MTANIDFVPPLEPWGLFKEWLTLAEQHEPNDPNAMAVATVGADGMPSVRILLMKGYGNNGFTFFTNRQSRKGGQLSAQPKAAICFHWKSLRRQVRAEGLITQVGEEESDAYFASRPRGSQIGAWASEQSRTLLDRPTLVARVSELEKEFERKPITRPPHWGGYRLTPVMMEFWQDREFRLHDRFVYRRADASAAWAIERLYP